MPIISQADATTEVGYPGREQQDTGRISAQKVLQRSYHPRPTGEIRGNTTGNYTGSAT